ncbi:hypothetical protein TNCV_643731, partial [Trichonephila clavipes]
MSGGVVVQEILQHRNVFIIRIVGAKSYQGVEGIFRSLDE